MIRFLCDENFNHDILRGLLRASQVDLLRIQDLGLAGSDDRTILEASAREGRVLLTHDIRTMAHYAYERVRSGLPMPGVVVIDPDLAMGQVIHDVIVLAECSREGEWEGQVCYLPL